MPFRIVSVAAGVLLFNSVSILSVHAAEGKKLTVGLTVPTLVNPFFVGMDRGVRDRCGELGFNVIAPNANNDMATQDNQMEDLITKKVDVIIICPINADAIVPAVKKANTAKIPVLALDRGSTAGDLAVFIESNNVEMGQKGADWIADHLKERYGEAKGNVVDLQGLRGTTAAESREKGFTEEIKKYPNIHLVASQAADFDQEKALNLTTDILQANSKVDAIFCANDDNAVGAIKAIQAMKRLQPMGAKNHIFVIGIDGTAQALEDIRNGTLDATISQNPVKMASKAVDFAQQILGGQKLDSHVFYPSLLLDKSNIDSPEAKAYGLWGDMMAQKQ